MVTVFETTSMTVGVGPPDANWREEEEEALLRRMSMFGGDENRVLMVLAVKPTTTATARVQQNIFSDEKAVEC